MLTGDLVRTWLDVIAHPPINEHALASASKRDPLLARAWKHSALIDDLLQDAHLVKSGKASSSFESEFRQRLAQKVEGPEVADLIWNAA
jgi:hypothetical protein